MTPQAYCRQRVAQSASSFYYGFAFLARPRREAVTALYAFCREVDDAVDECSDPAVARAKLAWWRDELAAAFAGRPTHPVTQALAPVIERHALPQEQFEEIIEGMAMDLEFTRYADFKSLQLYCYRVAGVVGLLAAEIFGVTDRATHRYAQNLGIALQLTNIIRDVAEDAQRGRIYLPQDEMTSFQVVPADVLHGRETPQFIALMRHQVARARSYYELALAALPAADRKAQRPGLAMAAIYRRLLDEIEREGCHVLKERVRLTALAKLWLAGQAWIGRA